MAQGVLDAKMKTMIALATATAARSPYLISAHTAALKRLGTDAVELEELMSVVQVTLGLTPDLET